MLRMITKKMSLQLVTIFLLVTSNAHALTALGKTDCGQWFTNPELSQAYLLGFLSGLNVMAEVNKGEDVLKKLSSNQQVFLWMHNYCKNNPLKGITDGGQRLFIELSR